MLLWKLYEITLEAKSSLTIYGKILFVTLHISVPRAWIFLKWIEIELSFFSKSWNKNDLSPYVIFNVLLCNEYILLLTLFRMGFFGAAHGWGGEVKPVTHILQWWNLAQLYLTQRRCKKYMNHVTNPLNSADISIFSTEISKFCYIKK